MRDSTVPLTQGFGSATHTVMVQPSPEGAHLEVVASDDGGIELHDRMVEAKGRTAPDRFNANLAEVMESGALETLASDVLEGVEADIESRNQFIQNLEKTMELLGLETEDPSNSKGAAGVSRVRHPVLLEAVVKAQSQAMAELLPSDGPVKAATRNGDDATVDDLARSFQEDMNWYLTKGAPEFYPDMDRGLFALFFSGNLFKKVYNHPLRRRPVSESIVVSDLIVSQDATDLDTAIRVTHRGLYTTGELRRMQWKKFWLEDIEIGTPMPSMDAVQRKEASIIGVQPSSTRQKDTEHTIYEVTTDYDFDALGLHEPGAPDVPLPIIVTIEKDSRKILAVRRGWKQGDKEYQRKQRFVHYGMVPAFSFLCLGYSHLLGNQTKALTAIWRILVDAGMFSNFPGGIKAKGVRTSTNDISPAPGEWVDIDTGPFDDISKAIMPMPYKGPDQVFMALADAIGTKAEALAGAVDIPVTGQDIPVGTMLAMVEQATQTTAAVHKRLHAAQSKELSLLKDCFADDPESLVRLNPNPQRASITSQEIDSLDIVPTSDPNVPAQIHRIMLATAMITVSGQAPQLYNVPEIHRRAWKMIGVNDMDKLILDAQPTPPDPKVQLQQANLQLAQQKLQFAQEDGKRKSEADQAQNSTDMQQQQMDLQQSQAENQSRLQIEQMRQQTEGVRLQIEQIRAHQAGAKDDNDKAFQASESQKDRDHALAMAGVQHGHDTIKTVAGFAHKSHETDKGFAHAAQQSQVGFAQDRVAAQQDQQHEATQSQVGFGQQQQLTKAQHDHALKLQKAKPKPKPAATRVK